MPYGQRRDDTYTQLPGTGTSRVSDDQDPSCARAISLTKDARLYIATSQSRSRRRRGVSVCWTFFNTHGTYKRLRIGDLKATFILSDFRRELIRNSSGPIGIFWPPYSSRTYFYYCMYFVLPLIIFLFCSANITFLAIPVRH
jgi:hypothetical protein